MSSAICPQCGQELQEPIPASLVGTIQLRCPQCQMIFSYQHDTEEIRETEEYYLSTGLFSRRPIHGLKDKSASKDSPLLRVLLLFCIFGPLVLLGIYAIIVTLSSILGWANP